MRCLPPPLEHPSADAIPAHASAPARRPASRGGLPARDSRARSDRALSTRATGCADPRFLGGCAAPRAQRDQEGAAARLSAVRRKPPRPPARSRRWRAVSRLFGSPLAQHRGQSTHLPEAGACRRPRRSPRGDGNCRWAGRSRPTTSSRNGTARRMGGPRSVHLSELFVDGKDTLFLYSFMIMKPEQGLPFVSPCPSCTSIIDGIDGELPHITHRVNFAVATKAPWGGFARTGSRAGGAMRGCCPPRPARTTSITWPRTRMTINGRSPPCLSAGPGGFTTSGAVSCGLPPRRRARTLVTSTSCGRCGRSSTVRPKDAATSFRRLSTAERHCRVMPALADSGDTSTPCVRRSSRASTWCRTAGSARPGCRGRA
jgi:hypothetical protein